ncbi:MAG: tRNA (N6-threonylcarbamoyladenosine(37)-N6)-methyltransferase TrmO [Promethearchaeota archaeon]|jgi:tRNA-Thr(GGU) m(6)t(6)A37 methyltransferase TsaA
MEILKRELINPEDRELPEKICFKPIGIIHSPFKTLKGIPIQSALSESRGVIEIFPEYIDGLKDLSGFSHIYCLYFFDMVKLPVPLHSKPFLDNEERGVFAIRTPFRPNPLGISILEILEIEHNNINVIGIDILDKTPILDIKPYIDQIDNIKTKRIGWINGKIKKKVS